MRYFAVVLLILGIAYGTRNAKHSTAVDGGRVTAMDGVPIPPHH